MKKRIIIISLCALISFIASYCVRLYYEIHYAYKNISWYNAICNMVTDSIKYGDSYREMHFAKKYIEDMKYSYIDKYRKMSDTLWLQWLQKTDTTSEWILFDRIKLANIDSKGNVIDSFSFLKTPQFFFEDIKHIVPKLDVASLKNIRVKMHISYDTCSYDTVLVIRTNSYHYLLDNYWKIKEKQVLTWGKHKLKVSFEVNKKGDIVSDSIEYNIAYKEFKIKDIEFANVFGSLIINNFGEKLYSTKMKYLLPKIIYCGDKDSNLIVYRKLYEPDNQLQTKMDEDKYGKRPSEYSYIPDTVKIKPGDNQIFLNAWGDSKSVYRPGTYRLELWIDNKKVFEKPLTIYKKEDRL